MFGAAVKKQQFCEGLFFETKRYLKEFNLHTIKCKRSSTHASNDVLPHQLMRYDKSCVFNSSNDGASRHWMHVYNFSTLTVYKN